MHEGVGEKLHRVAELLGQLLAAIARFVLDVLTVVLRLLVEAIEALAPYVPLLVKASCVATPIAAIVIAFPLAHVAYGGDVPALLAAAVLTLLPVLAALPLRWGGLLVSALIVVFTGYGVSVLHPLVRSLLLVAVLAGISTYQLFNSQEEEHESTTLEDRS